MKLKAAVICAVILLAAACGVIYVRGTPQYSIYQLGRAVANHDPDTALTYIDVDSVTESLVRSMFLDAGASRRLDKNMQAAISMNMPSIKEGVKTYIITYIRTGGPGDGQKGEDPLGMRNLGLYDLGVAALWRLNVKRDGKTAIVSLKGKPGQAAKMVKTEGGYWRFAAVLIDQPGKE